MEGITAEEVISFEFPIVRRGYDPVEVDRFLERMAAELDRLRNLVTHQFGSAQTAVQVIERATRMADEIVADARAAAEQVEANASRQIGRVVDEARNEAQTLREQAEATAQDITLAAAAEAQRLRDRANHDRDVVNRIVDHARLSMLRIRAFALESASEMEATLLMGEAQVIDFADSREDRLVEEEPEPVRLSSKPFSAD